MAAAAALRSPIVVAPSHRAEILRSFSRICSSLVIWILRSYNVLGRSRSQLSTKTKPPEMNRIPYLERPPEFLACRESPINRNYLSPTESTPYRQTPKSMVRFPRSSCQDGIESGRCADTWHGLQP